MILDEKNNNDRPIAYPKPTETDMQLNNQPEYTEVFPNKSEADDVDVVPETKESSSDNTSAVDKVTNPDRTRNSNL
jgi:hypothetical protein